LNRRKRRDGKEAGRDKIAQGPGAARDLLGRKVKIGGLWKICWFFAEKFE
jgi:hypothetical protein